MTELILSMSGRDEVIETEDMIVVYSQWNNNNHNNNNEDNDGNININKTGMKVIS
ncbi:unnamed protein product, partial [Schistosoma rodhaini]